MQAGGGADLAGVVLQGGATGELGLLELLNVGKVTIDQGSVRQRPAVLSQL